MESLETEAKCLKSNSDRLYSVPDRVLINRYLIQDLLLDHNFIFTLIFIRYHKKFRSELLVEVQAGRDVPFFQSAVHNTLMKRHSSFTRHQNTYLRHNSYFMTNLISDQVCT